MHLKWIIRKNLTRLKVWPFFELSRMALHYFLRKPHDPEFLGLKQLNIVGLCLDLGANQGQSAITILSLLPQTTVFSIEPNPAMKMYLKLVGLFLGNRFEFKNAAVGSSNGHLKLLVPSIDGISLTQEVTSNRDILNSPTTKDRMINLTGKYNFHTDEFEIPVHKVDDLNLSPSLVKLDLQGMEIDALSGMQITLKKLKPIVLTEMSEDFESINTLLSNMGYMPFIFDVKSKRFLQVSDALSTNSSINAYFIPAEKSPVSFKNGCTQNEGNKSIN